MKLFGKDFLFNGNKVYHAGSKPTASEIGAAAANHAHAYLPLSGGSVTGNIIPSGADNLGSKTNLWYRTYTKLIETPNGTINGDLGMLGIDTVGMKFFFQNDQSSTIPCFRPEGENIYLGHSAHRWHTLYTVPVTLTTRGESVSQILTNNTDWSIRDDDANGIDFLRGPKCLIPSKNAVFDLGSENNMWKNVLLRGAVINDVTNRVEGYFAFANNGRYASAIYGKPNGEMGLYDSLNSRHILMYSFPNGTPEVTFTGTLKTSATNTFDIGDSNYRWRTIYSVNALNSSDKNSKENIEYISDDKTKNNKITYEDMYNFYKDIELATYNYKNQEHQEFGFIAQDIAKTRVGSQIALDLEAGYMYSVGSYISSVAGALKQCINEIEILKSENNDLRKELQQIKDMLIQKL